MDKFEKLVKLHHLEKYQSDLEKLSRKTTKLYKFQTEEDLDLGTSKMGGFPDLPKDFSFPMHDGRYLSFLMQLNLSEFKEFDQDNILPSEGMLYFFYDVEEQPWGFAEDKGAWKVFYFNGDKSELTRTSFPEESVVLPCFSLKFEVFSSLPENTGELEFETEEDEDNYWSLRHALISDSPFSNGDEVTNLDDFVGTPYHFVLGHPYNVQNDVFLVAEHYKNIRLYGENYHEATGISDDSETTEKEWVLLFQMDSDDDLEVMWGDAGMIYFCIEKENLDKLKFDEVWLQLQCH